MRSLLDQGCYFGVNHVSIPRLSHPFILCMDSCNTHLGGLLVQVDPNTKGEMTISTFSCKHNPAKLNYPIMDKELLGIMETLKHFHNVFYGAKILAWKDHKNICHKDAKHTSQWVLCQCIFISQEYSAKIAYYEGKNKTGADGLYRLPRSIIATKSA